MPNQCAEFSVALREAVHREAGDHLLQWRDQEDLCFALWYPSEGARRFSALIAEVILPYYEDRRVHGNVGFTAEYFVRALSMARARKAGLALMHSHLGPGWQGMSSDDIQAESGHAGAVRAATGLPFLGLTAGNDGAWSGRFWKRTGERLYTPMDVTVVRVVGHRLGLTYHPTLGRIPSYGLELDRTTKALGPRGWADIVRMRIGIVGLGSVGSLVNEALARLGAEHLVLVDFDKVKRENRDRTAGTGPSDIGRYKVDVAADNAIRSATSPRIRIDRVSDSIINRHGYAAALDCDLLFSCVDRPWPRRVMNHIAYAHLIPVIDGGILVRLRGDRMIGADWHCHTVGPGRRCLECIGAYDPSVVGLEIQGLLDDPSYMAQLDPGSPLVMNENVFPFSMNLASLEVMQMLALVLGPIYDLGDQNYHYASGTLDVNLDQHCNPGCLYPGIVATGDTLYVPTGEHLAARQKKTGGSPSKRRSMQHVRTHCQKVLDWIARRVDSFAVHLRSNRG